MENMNHKIRTIIITLVSAMLLSAVSCSTVDDGGSPNESSSESASMSQSESESESESADPLEEIRNLQVYSPVLELTSIGAPEPGPNYSHGGNQTRVVRTSHGTYAVYLSGEPKLIGSDDWPHYSLIRIDPENGKCTVLREGYYLGSSNAPYIMADKDENVYAVCGHSTTSNEAHGIKSIIWKYDPNTEEVSEYNSYYLCGAPFGGYGYAMGFIDDFTGQLYIVYCGGDARGRFAIIRFDLESCEYIGKYEFPIAGRHCYLFGFSDGKGGFTVSGQRDVSLKASGHKDQFPDDYHASYVWDDLRMFRFTIDENDNVVMTDIVEVDLADYVDGSGCFPSNLYYRDGDIFRDQAGNLHYIYRNEDDNGINQIIEYHVIYDSDFNEIYRAPIILDPSYYSAEYKMYQTTEGIYYIIATPKSIITEETLPVGPIPVNVSRRGVENLTVALYRSEDGINYTKVSEKVYEGKKVVPYHLPATQSRNGSLIDGVVGLLIPDNDTWYYCSVDLAALELKLANGIEG